MGPYLSIHPQVILVMGYFDPWSFTPQDIGSLVISALKSFQPLGHFGHGSFRPWVISAPGHFGPLSFWVPVHYNPWSFAPGCFGPMSFQSLVILAPVIWFLCCFNLGSFQSLVILVMLFPGHFCLGSFQSWSFLHQDVSELGHFSPVSLWSCHYGPESFRPSGHFSHGSFHYQVILVPGHFYPWSFGWVIPVPGHFGHVTFQSLVISAL